MSGKNSIDYGFILKKATFSFPNSLGLTALELSEARGPADLTKETIGLLGTGN